jgi:hypothetical protein
MIVSTTVDEISIGFILFIDENAAVVPPSPTLHVASVIPDKSITRSNIVTDHDYTMQQSVVMRQQSSDDKSNKRSNICPWLVDFLMFCY